MVNVIIFNFWANKKEILEILVGNELFAVNVSENLINYSFASSSNSFE